MFTVSSFKQWVGRDSSTNREGGVEKKPGNLEDRLYSFLARHRATPQSSTGQTPSELVLKTPPRTRLDLLRPCVQNLVLQKQAYEKQRHDAHTVDRTFIAGDRYWALNCQGNPSGPRP